MFTGIVEEVGQVVRNRISRYGVKIVIHAPEILSELPEGGSIAVEGVCLTVTSKTKEDFSADIMPVTAVNTTLGALPPGTFVNLERAIPVTGRFDGHIVTGHVDYTGEIIVLTKNGNAHLVQVKVPPTFLRYLIPQGSIALDGTSLTIVNVTPGAFMTSIIPHTWAYTSIRYKQPGSRVNLECDPIAKHVFHYVTNRFAQEKKSTAHSQELSQELLRENGFL